MQKLFVILLLCGLIIPVFSQNCPEGFAAFRNQEYEKALKSYSNCLKKSPGDSSLIYMNGLVNV
jgi:hypothetical protein